MPTGFGMMMVMMMPVAAMFASLPSCNACQQWFGGAVPVVMP
jgi:hypothetical protein